jgi:hypothetical protein
LMILSILMTTTLIFCGEVILKLRATETTEGYRSKTDTSNSISGREM